MVNRPVARWGCLRVCLPVSLPDFLSVCPSEGVEDSGTDGPVATLGRPLVCLSAWLPVHAVKKQRQRRRTGRRTLSPGSRLPPTGPQRMSSPLVSLSHVSPCQYFYLDILFASLSVHTSCYSLFFSHTHLYLHSLTTVCTGIFP